MDNTGDLLLPLLFQVSSKEVNKFQMVSFWCSLCPLSQGKSQPNVEPWVNIDI